MKYTIQTQIMNLGQVVEEYRDCLYTEKKDAIKHLQSIQKSILEQGGTVTRGTEGFSYAFGDNGYWVMVDVLCIIEEEFHE